MPTKFIGTVSYTLFDDRVEIRIERIKNDNDGGHTGTLKIQLITADYSYSGGTLFGSSFDILADFNMDILPGGYSRRGIKKSCKKLHQHDRTHIILLLKEHNSASTCFDKFPIIDYRNFDKKSNWHPEKILYHGTTQQNAKKIQETNLRPSSCGRLGSGIYFTQSKKEAAKIGSRFKEPFAVIECVVKGHWKTSRHPDWAGIGYDFKEYCVPNNKYVRVKKVHFV